MIIKDIISKLFSYNVEPLESVNNSWDSFNSLAKTFNCDTQAPLGQQTQEVIHAILEKKEFRPLLRQILESQVYQALKEDPNDPNIKIIHRICIALWNDLNGFCVGENWFNNQPVTDHALTGAEVVTKLKRVELKRKPEDALVFGKNLANMGRRPVTVHNSFGKAKATPEFLAMLQGIKNNLHAEKVNQALPQLVLYTNYEEFNLMELNKSHSEVFFGITLSRESDIYLNKLDRDWTDAAKFGNEIRNYFLHGSTFSLIGRDIRDACDGRFYFPGTVQEWILMIDEIIAKANERFSQIPQDLKLHATASQLRVVYQEYMYSMIENYLEMALAKKLEYTHPIILSIRASDAVKFIYNNLDDHYFDPDKKMKTLNVLANAMWAPLSDPIASYLRYVDHKAFKEDRSEIISSTGAFGISYHI